MECFFSSSWFTYAFVFQTFTGLKILWLFCIWSQTLKVAHICLESRRQNCFCIANSDALYFFLSSLVRVKKFLLLDHIVVLCCFFFFALCLVCYSTLGNDVQWQHEHSRFPSVVILHIGGNEMEQSCSVSVKLKNAGGGEKKPTIYLQIVPNTIY